jgi:hypothetical protein
VAVEGAEKLSMIGPVGPSSSSLLELEQLTALTRSKPKIHLFSMKGERRGMRRDCHENARRGNSFA